MTDPAPPEPARLDQDPEWVREARERVLAWSETSREGLPWRAEREPYRVLVSEFMLVQTTVATVIPFYSRFLDQFPTLADLAAADEAQVLRAWEGLGYYRRARQLHAAARAVAAHHRGVVPDDPAALRSLPGVGRYIAGAILSFAFNQAEPIVEANTQRLLARLLAWNEPLDRSSGRERLWQAAARLVPESSPGRFNQNLMDLGATVCTPRQPRCLACPLSTICEAKRSGLQDQIPVLPVRTAPLAVEEACVAIERDNRLLCVRRAPNTLWAGMWELPTAHLDGADPARRRDGKPAHLAQAIEHATGLRLKVGAAIKQFRYTVTTHRVTLHLHRGSGEESGEPRPGAGLDQVAWILRDHLGELAFGSAQRRVLRWLDQHPQGS